jgi:plastocyanin
MHLAQGQRSPWILGGLAAFALALAGCGSKDEPAAGGGGGGGKKTGPATRTVEIVDSKYVPETVTVKVGETVKWINRDGLKHTATRSSDPTFDTGNLGKNDESAPITFTKDSDATGWEYRCTVKGHDMTGHVVVTK